MTNSIRAVSLVATLAGCLPGPAGPKPGAVPTGEQLAVVDDVKQWTTQSEEETGRHTYVHADGSEGGTVVDTKTVYTPHQMKIWYPVQGTSQINDEDLFKFSHDDQALKATQDMHASGRTFMTLGFVGMAIGIAGMIAGKYVGDGGTLSIGLYSGGSIVGLVGAYGYYRGYEMESPDSHAVDRSVANNAAANYNKQLGHSASLTLMKRDF